jgi:hypothetical protein
MKTLPRVEYDVINSWNLDDFIEEVNEKLAENWELVGCFVVTVNGESCYHQAMIRENW